MKKKLLSALLSAAMLTGILAGCGNDATTPAADSSTTEAPAADTQTEAPATDDAAEEPAADDAAETAPAADEGKVLNIYCWNEEFKSRITDHYPDYTEVDATSGTIGDVSVKWNITPNADNAYQNNQNR